MSLFLKFEGGVSLEETNKVKTTFGVSCHYHHLLGGGLGLGQWVDLDELEVRLEAGAVVGGVLHDLDLAVLIQKSVFA